MSNKLTETALDLLLIEKDILYRMDYSKEDKHFRVSVDDFAMYIFEQTWGSTALGFGGIGGQAMTTANTYVFIPVTCHQNCFVYFDGRFAYQVPYSKSFMEDVRNHSMKSVNQSRLYIKEVFQKLLKVAQSIVIIVVCMKYVLKNIQTANLLIY